MVTAILERLDHKRQEIVALTQELVRVPTINPPGDAYQACAALVGERLCRRGFEVRYLRAEGTPGDTARHPRINVVARRENGRPGAMRAFLRPHRRSARGAGMERGPVGGRDP